MSTAEKPLLTTAEYLAFERASETKHEFHRGEVFAMTGASRNHNRITTNISGELYAALKGSPCENYASDMRVKVDATGLYTYPDIVATCANAQFEDKEIDTLLNPQLIIEVLSDSTEKYDRGEKFIQYREIPSLNDYVLVSQKQPRVEVFSRQDDGSWVMRVADSPTASVTFPSVGVTLKMQDVYARVEYESDATE
jgi:Uma2 family endonuclease